MAPQLEIPGGLTSRHWEVIYFIRNTLEEYGKCPLVFQTCKANGLRLRELTELFPTGYQRGACKIAGLNLMEGYLRHYTFLPIPVEEGAEVSPDKTYRVDIRGFLVDPSEWDEQFAVFKAHEFKMPGNLTDRHWKVIYFLRQSYQEHEAVPTVYETCKANNMEIEELGELFPDGYHRGAVKLAGLKLQ